MPKSTPINRTKYAFVLLIAFSTFGCMTWPMNGSIVADTNAPLSFGGYHIQSNTPVQVKAWNYNTNRMTNLGGTINSSRAGVVGVFDSPIYEWSGRRTLAPNYWRDGPNGGQCAVATASTVLSGRTYSIMTLDPDWGSCLSSNPTLGGFYSNCRSVNFPYAELFTPDWQPLEISEGTLGTAGILASRQVSIVLDNYTPTEFEFCSAATPAGCPTPTSDPNTYKYYKPNGGAVTADGASLEFSIAPARENYMTVYIDEMASNRIQFSVEGTNTLVMQVDFESAGPEIRMNCIDNFICGFIGNPTLELGSPSAALRFPLIVRAGEVTYNSATVAFTATGDSNVQNAASSIGIAMQDKINNDASVKSAISATLDGLLHQAGAFDAVYPISEVTVVGSGLRVKAGCPRG